MREIYNYEYFSYIYYCLAVIHALAFQMAIGEQHADANSAFWSTVLLTLFFPFAAIYSSYKIISMSIFWLLKVGTATAAEKQAELEAENLYQRINSFKKEPHDKR